MAMPKLNKTQLPALISFVIIFASYIGEKALKRLTPWSATSAILQAIALTAAVLAVFLLLLKCKDYFAGLLVSILAFKILPPNLQMLHDTAFDAAAVFFLVRKAALAMFLYLAYYFYQQLKKEQPDNYAHVWGIASILLIFPYITSVATDYEKYIMLKTGNTLLVHAVTALAYVCAFLIMTGFCFKFKGNTARLICAYGIIVLITRMLRKATVVMILTAGGNYVGKSNFAWIAICAVLLVYMIIVRKKTAFPETASE